MLAHTHIQTRTHTHTHTHTYTHTNTKTHKTNTHTQGQPEVKFFLHNHLRFTILFHKDEVTDLARIVGFEVEPFSVKHTYKSVGSYDALSPTLDTCNPGRMEYVTHDTAPQAVKEGEEVIFTYDVKFVVGARDHARGTK